MPVTPFLVVPVKPSSGSKQRLATTLPDSGRQLVSLALARRVVSLAARVWPRGAMVVVSSESQLSPLCERLRVAQIADPGAGQTAAVRSGVCWALERGARVVATVAADLPAVEDGDLRVLLARARSLDPGSMIIYPDREGSGTNGVVVAPGRLLPYAFGPGSRHRHECVASRLGLKLTVEVCPGFSWDLDRPEDLDSTGVGNPHPLVSWALALSGEQPSRVGGDGGV